MLGPSLPTPTAIAVLARLIAGSTADQAAIAALPEPWHDVAEQIGKVDGEGRLPAFQAAVNGWPNAKQIMKAVLAMDPNAPLPKAAPAGRTRKTVWTASELLEATFTEPTWIVPGLLPTGLATLAGRPKTGKSWLLLQLAIAVACGGVFFDRRVQQGRVLFLALEDSERRLKKRLELQGAPVGADITFALDWPPLSRGGLARLQAEIEQGGYRLVCIDTFSRLVGNVDQDSVGLMTVLMSSLQELAETGERCLLLNDHHRKPSMYGADPVDDILGSTGKAAVVDTALGLYRQKGKREVLLKVVGRDVEEQELALRWDALTGCWQCLGEADDVRRDSEKGQVLAAVKELSTLGELPTATRIAQHTGLQRPNVARSLAALVVTGKLVVGKRVGRELPYRLI
jgi:hypothetical protein